MNELNGTPRHQEYKNMNQPTTNRPVSPAPAPATKAATPSTAPAPATKATTPSAAPVPASLAKPTPQPQPAQPPKPEPKKPEPRVEAKAEAKPETKPQTRPALTTVRFEIEAPKATSVSVAGTLNDWKPGATPLTGVGGGR